MKRIFLCLLILLHAGAAGAQATFQFAAPDFRTPEDPNVEGMRLSVFHGKNQSTSGFDLGLIGVSETETLTGFSLVAGMSRVTKAMDGAVSIGVINYHTGSDRGVNAAFINKLNDAEKAVDIAFVNIADGATMFDLGGVNVSGRSNVQLGFINVTKKIEGFQFGFINVASNGFFPVFPIFNFPKAE